MNFKDITALRSFGQGLGLTMSNFSKDFRFDRVRGDELCYELLLRANGSRDIEIAQRTYNLFVQLIEHGIIGLDQVYKLLEPPDLEINENWSSAKKATVRYALDSMKVRLGGNGNQDDGNAPEDNLDNYMSMWDVVQINQKVHFLQTYIDFGISTHVLGLLKRYPKYTLTRIGPVGKSIGQWINFLIDPMYRKIENCQPLPPDAQIIGRPPYFPLSSLSTKQPQTYQEFDQIIVPILIQLGPYIYSNPEVLCKILRIFKYFLTGLTQNNLPKNDLYYNILTILSEGFLPALSCLAPNPGVAHDLWEVLKLYPYEVRYKLYSTWKSESLVTSHPILLTKQADLTKQLKQLVKRISKENVEQMSRKIVKMILTMPVVVLDYILVQVQLFDNLIPPLIDTLKYLTEMGKDIIVYCLLEVLCPPSPSGTIGSPESKALSLMLTPNRSRTKHDGMTISSWVQNIATFTGALCERYRINIVPILQFIANQLKDKQSLDLLLLKSIIFKMSGIEVSEQITTDHLNAQSGGINLKFSAGYFGKINPDRKCVERLINALKENDLGPTLCILMAQQKEQIMFNRNQANNSTEGELHVKLVGGLFDQCQDTLVQLGIFLAHCFDIKGYEALFPVIEELLENCKFQPDITFFLWRPVISNQLNELYTKLLQPELRRLPSYDVMSNEAKGFVFAKALNDVLKPIATVFQNSLEPKLWENISPELYTAFWSLQLSDIRVPYKSYDQELERITRDRNALRLNVKLSETEFIQEKIKLTEEEQIYRREQSQQVLHVERVFVTMSLGMQSWFPERKEQRSSASKLEHVNAFLQACISPRVQFSSLDALYCAEFLKMLHRIKTPNFPSLMFYDKIICDSIALVSFCTANEASRYGRFLSSLLELTLHWHSSPRIFAEECSNYPGFMVKLKGAPAETRVTAGSSVGYEAYRHMCFKWQYKLTMSVTTLLSSGEFLHIRNCLLVLTTLLPSYPKIKHFAFALELRIAALQEAEKNKESGRQDLYVLATSYLGQLKKQLKNVIPQEEFHIDTKTNISPGPGGKRPKLNGVIEGSTASSN